MRQGAAVAHAHVVVLGTGAAGLVAALSARCAGAEVVLLESTGAVGGTTALSGGTCWIPCNHHQDPAGPPDTPRRCARLPRLAVPRPDPMPTWPRRSSTTGPTPSTGSSRSPTCASRSSRASPTTTPSTRAAGPAAAARSMPGLFPFGAPRRVGRPRGSTGDRNPHLTMHETTSAAATGRLDREELPPRRVATTFVAAARRWSAGCSPRLLDGASSRGSTHRAVDLLVEDGARRSASRVDTPDGEIDVACCGRRGARHRRVRVGPRSWSTPSCAGPMTGPVVDPDQHRRRLADGDARRRPAGEHARGVVGADRRTSPVTSCSAGPRQIVQRERTLPRSIMVNRHGRRFANEAANYNAFGGAFHQFDPTDVRLRQPAVLARASTTSTRRAYGFAGSAAATPRRRGSPRRRRPRGAGRDASAFPPTR